MFAPDVLHSPLGQVLWTIVPIWVFGALVGYLAARPKSWKSGALVLSSFFGPQLKQLALAWHASVIVREIWYRFTARGTFRGLLWAVIRWGCGHGWVFELPSKPAPPAPVERPSLEVQLPLEPDNWYVGAKDLAFFQYHAEQQGPCEGASRWQLMMDKEIPGAVKYKAWRRTLANGKTEYRSTTIAADATAQETMDAYMDDDNRALWDSLIVKHDVLEDGDFGQRQQVVRWVRSFPFSFLSDREYIIARRLYRTPDALYGVTKGLADHPNAAASHAVRCPSFWSMWASRTVACPWGSDRPATETVLLHHEDFKIPEHLARFAVKHGMWGFVQKMAKAMPAFVAARRKRVDSYAEDMEAYGHASARRLAPAGDSPAALRMRASFSAPHLVGTPPSSLSRADSEVFSAASDANDADAGRPRRSKHLRRLAIMALASGVAVLVGRKGRAPQASHGHSHGTGHYVHGHGHHDVAARAASHGARSHGSGGQSKVYGLGSGVHVHRHSNHAVHLAHEPQRRPPARGGASSSGGGSGAGGSTIGVASHRLD